MVRLEGLEAVALAYHHGLLFISLRYTYVTPTSSPQFASIYLTSLHFASPHFTSPHFLMIYTKLSLHLIYHFPNHCPKITWFRGESL
jgi:hypothetical protein